MLKRNRQKGFTLIELLIVVAIIGIIAAILIPNLIDALQKAKQKRTMADLRNTGNAWMSWLTDQVGAASAGAAPSYPGSLLTTSVDHDTLQEYLNPANNASFFYMQEVPETDGWKHDYEWFRNANLLAGNVMISCSKGRDNSYDATPGQCNGDWTPGPFVATDYDRDIVWADGYLVQYPGKV